MKRSVKLPGIGIAAVLLSALAWPAAQAGSEIVKCVDDSGHVTLTDQPCTAGSESVPLSAAATVRPAQHHVLPAAELRHAAWKRPAVPRPAPLSRDVATLKEARRTMLLQEARTSLVAGLN